MCKTEIEYRNRTLYINLEGIVNKSNIKELRRKLYYIISEYQISDIVLNIKDTQTLDKDAFYGFLDEYDMKYGGNLEVIE